MELLEILREKREAVADRWRELVLETYPPQSVTFLGKEKDGFRNPVGATIRQAIGDLVEGLTGGADAGVLAGPLDALVRMRAVQGFSPGETVGFVFLFRRALGDVLREELETAPAGELLELYARLDEMALAAWDRYAICREKISEIRAREATARTYSLLKRAGLLVEAFGATETGTCSRAEGRS
jgi:hypothetical protein